MRAAITALVVPLTMPQMSPTTSLQTLETLLALRSRERASLAPFTFRAAMEWKGLGSAAVTATPMISNRIPSRINSAKIKVAIATPAPSSIDSDARLSAADRAIAMVNT